MTAGGTPGEIHYPNIIGRLILNAITEILGAENAHEIFQNTQLKINIESYQGNNLELQFSAAQLSSILSAIEIRYNQPAGRGLALRAGRVCFKMMIREFGYDLGLAKPEIRLLPVRKKLPEISQIFAGVMNQEDHDHIEIETDQHSLLWHVSKCPICWERQSESPACHFGVGILQESLYWLSGGKDYLVEEINCIAAGAKRCTFQILYPSVN